jgi:cytochrome c-type biogenesis protein CcmE
MNMKVIVAAAIVVMGIVLGAVNFLDSNVEYGDFATAQKTHKKIQVKGEWLRNRETTFNTSTIQFTFYMKDDSGVVSKVVLDGARPNNFDLATAIVAKGRYADGYFHATEILTKCPSKYEGPPPGAAKTS